MREALALNIIQQEHKILRFKKRIKQKRSKR